MPSWIGAGFTKAGCEAIDFKLGELMMIASGTLLALCCFVFCPSVWLSNNFQRSALWDARSRLQPTLLATRMNQEED